MHGRLRLGNLAIVAVVIVMPPDKEIELDDLGNAIVIAVVIVVVIRPILVDLFLVCQAGCPAAAEHFVGRGRGRRALAWVRVVPGHLRHIARVVPGVGAPQHVWRQAQRAVWTRTRRGRYRPPPGTHAKNAIELTTGAIMAWLHPD